MRQPLVSGRVLLATRNPHKVSEIKKLLTDLRDVEFVSPADLGVIESPAEDLIEVFESFEENAWAKARHFFEQTGVSSLADDSGLCVDALGGGPGVRSRRFAPGPERSRPEQDVENNRHLLALLEGVPEGDRGAHYECALSLVGPGFALTVEGRVDGTIALEAAGDGGFGYDPLFRLPEFGLTFGQLPPEVKAERSHRADAVRKLYSWITR